MRGEGIRGNARQAGLLRISHGLAVEDTASPDPHEELRRQLRAWQLVLPEDAVFTHVTGACLRRWQLPALPDDVPVFASTTTDRRPRRPGLVCSRLVRPGPEVLGELTTDAPEEVLLRSARDLGVLDVLVMMDSARRCGDIDRLRMEALLESGRPGVATLRKAWGMSSHKAHSGPETLLRVFHWALDIPVEPQAVLHDGAGNVVGQADLLVVGTRRLHEYDGAHHREPHQQKTDLRRTRGLSQTGYDRRGFTLDDLLNHSLVLMHELDRDLERPHRMSRIRRWRALVDDSLYSQAGRTRVLNRWWRSMGRPDWSQTA